MILLIIFYLYYQGGLGHDTITSSNSGIFLVTGDDVISAKEYVNEIYVGSGSNRFCGGGNILFAK